jgi:hypothetical protein
VGYTYIDIDQLPYNETEGWYKVITIPRWLFGEPSPELYLSLCKTPLSNSSTDGGGIMQAAQLTNFAGPLPPNLPEASDLLQYMGKPNNSLSQDALNSDVVYVTVGPHVLSFAQ